MPVNTDIAVASSVYTVLPVIPVGGALTSTSFLQELCVTVKANNRKATVRVVKEFFSCYDS